MNAHAAHEGSKIKWKWVVRMHYNCSLGLKQGLSGWLFCKMRMVIMGTHCHSSLLLGCPSCFSAFYVFFCLCPVCSLHKNLQIQRSLLNVETPAFLLDSMSTRKSSRKIPERIDRTTFRTNPYWGKVSLGWMSKKLFSFHSPQLHIIIKWSFHFFFTLCIKISLCEMTRVIAKSDIGDICPVDFFPPKQDHHRWIIAPGSI